MTATYFAFLPEAIFRLGLRGFLIYNLKCFQIQDLTYKHCFQYARI